MSSSSERSGTSTITSATSAIADVMTAARVRTNRPPLGRRLLASLFLVLLGASAPLRVATAVSAFPGAVGFGSTATGGRGGDVYHVTQLGDAGPGSLRDAIATASGPRTIVFEVSGVIELASPLSVSTSGLTIAGQTSPGGIGTRGYPVQVSGVQDVVIRYMRFRTGDLNAAAIGEKPSRGNGDLVGDAGDSLTISNAERVVVDHVSTSWGMDETLSVTLSSDVTVQHSIISESLHDSYHTEGAHGYGSLVRGIGLGGYSFVGNLYAHHVLRSPAVGGEQAPPPGEPRGGLDFDFVNNVVYDWSLLASHTLLGQGTLRLAFWNNVFIAGPSTLICPSCIFFAIDTAPEDDLRIYQSGNVFDDDQDGNFEHAPATIANFGGGPYTEHTWPFLFDRPFFETLSADAAYQKVLAEVGASRARDDIDVRIIQQLTTQTGSLIDSQDEVGGWPAPPPAPDAPTDLDRDGMADAWELGKNLDPNDPADRNALDLHPEYTNLEYYLASLDAPLACDDGLDDDGDQLVDYPEDPGCDSLLDTSEHAIGLLCDDGFDNDWDGKRDYPEDPGCGSPTWSSEQPSCDDRLDNDGDGFCDTVSSTCVDGSTPGDASCLFGFLETELPVCSDGLDNDEDGFVDLADPECANASQRSETFASCGLGWELVLVLPLARLARRLRKRR